MNSLDEWIDGGGISERMQGGDRICKEKEFVVKG